MKQKHIKILFAAGFICLIFSLAFGQSGISDYLKNLPKKYKTFEGDYLEPEKNVLIDEANGYAALMDAPIGNENASPVLEMAVFKSANKTDLIVVSNRKTDPVCSEFQTFFLRRKGNSWVDVSKDALPRLEYGLFFDNPRDGLRLAEINKADNGKRTAISYRVKPPRTGTKLEISLEICDYTDDIPEHLLSEWQTLIQKRKTLYFVFDKTSGKFKLEK